jgi:hypothetical protein
MNSKLSSTVIFSLLVLATGCGRSSSSRQRETELGELKISNSNLVAQLQQAKLKSDEDKSNQESEITEFKTEFTNLNAQLQQAKRQAEEEAKQAAERQKVARQQEVQESANQKKTIEQTVFKELIKLESIVGTGVTYDQYSERLLDTKTTIEMTLLEVDDSNFKSSVSDILVTFIDARDYWSLCIRNSSHFGILNDSGPDAMLADYIRNHYGKYKIPYEIASAGKSIILSSGQLSYIWGFANQQIDDLAKESPDL